MPQEVKPPTDLELADTEKKLISELHNWRNIKLQTIDWRECRETCCKVMTMTVLCWLIIGVGMATVVFLALVYKLYSN